jgi:hypothetical protein
MIGANPNAGNYRAPLVKEDQRGITIEEIEAALADSHLGWPTDQARARCLFFAVLKCGSSIAKLQEFTGYPRDFLIRNIEYLRSRGHLFTGTLSTQFVLDQVPDSEDLIERITGQRIITKKESPKMTGDPDYKKDDQPVERGGKSKAISFDKCDRPGCGKLKGHTGRHQGPQKRAAQASAPNQAAPVAQISGFKFSIKYIEDDDVRVELRGDSLQKLNSALDFINSLSEGRE